MPTRQYCKEFMIHAYTQLTHYSSAAVLLLALILIIFVADLIHLLLYARNKLRPSLFLVTNIAQICCWAGVVVLDLAVIAKGRGMRNKFFPILVS